MAHGELAISFKIRTVVHHLFLSLTMFNYVIACTQKVFADNYEKVQVQETQRIGNCSGNQTQDQSK